MKFELLSKQHNRKSFDCGHPAINSYFWQMANQHAQQGISGTHLITDDNDVILGFYTLSNTSIDNVGKVLNGYPERVPAILISRIGVDIKTQGKGISKLLLSHAINKAKSLSLDTGIAFIIINAKDEQLARYYAHFRFNCVDNFNDDLTLFLAIKDII